MLVILALGKWRLENQKFKVILCFIEELEASLEDKRPSKKKYNLNEQRNERMNDR